MKQKGNGILTVVTDIRPYIEDRKSKKKAANRLV
jgi:hypothetical protein